MEESPLARGRRLFDEGKWDAAVESLGEAIAKDPLDAEAYLFRGRAYHYQGRELIGPAIADFNEAIRLNPNNCEAYYSRAEAYKEKGDRDKALADSLKARRLDPNYASAANLHSNPSDEAFRRVIDRAQATLDTPTVTGNVSTDTLLDSVSEDLPLTSPRGKPAVSGLKTESGATSPTVKPRGAISTELRDAYGLPLSTDRSGSVTEDLFGVGRRRTHFESASPLRVPSVRLPGSLPDWQVNTNPPTAPPLDARPPQTASKPSPVGTLPFGNPYQPGGAVSPFSPVGPRSTGLQGDPTLRQSQTPYYDRPYDRRYGRDTIPAAEPGLQSPLVPPP